ncbi:hypothetical protein JX265_008328 [Neoarthrinium moseri]|uniref:Accumulation-associated protein n=1 Tax=Neoarthrinium moseri TaxID=1658444 RepID=A0A9P9WHP2_9PEZI|nr:hypothetical protein JX265_008328 [Neoarthrinium moseri]
MRFSLFPIIALEVLPAFSLPAGTVVTSVVQRREPFPSFRSKVPRGKQSARVGDAAAATNQTALAATDVLAVSEEFKEGVVRVVGVFGSPNPVQGGNLFTKMKLPANAAGAFEVEYNGTAANSITIAPKMATVPPPAGLMYIDPLTFTVTTATPPVGDDKHQIDYIFAEGSSNAVDVTKSVVGKLDAATNQFVTENLGELEFEAEENEIALKLADMNGEWAVFVPTTAVKAGEGEAAGGEAAAGEKAAGEAAAGEKAAGEKAAGEKAAGEKAAAEKADESEAEDESDSED